MLSPSRKRYMQARVAADDVDYMFESERRTVAMQSRAGRHMVLIHDHALGTEPYGFDFDTVEEASKVCAMYVDEITHERPRM